MNLRNLLLVVLLLAVPAVLAQNKDETAPQLFDSIGKSNGEGRSAKFDNFFVMLNNSPSLTGYVFVYCGKSCRYGEVESHLRGIELQINRRRFDRSRIVVLPGGYRNDQEVELWVRQSGAYAPVPSPSLNIKDVSFKKAGIRLVEPYDCCGSLDPQWNKFRRSK